MHGVSSLLTASIQEAYSRSAAESRDAATGLDLRQVRRHR
jgi:hypothetical protein